MAHDHPATDLDDDPNHICMWESHGHDPFALFLDYAFLQKQYEKSKQELGRLRALLTENNISWKQDSPSRTPGRTLRTRNAGKLHQTRSPRSPKTLPELPREIHFQIMAYALKSSTPIIDPFFKVRTNNLTLAEQKHSGRDEITIGLLGVCKAFNEEGMRLIVDNNQFIFTQVTAVENFARIPAASRATINHVVIRVVGRYYGEEAGTKNICWNPLSPRITQIFPRPSGLPRREGIEAYCWSQVADFVKALIVLGRTSSPNTYTKLLPGLLTMRMDLVNFCYHLPVAGSRFLTVMRLHSGGIVDELFLTRGVSEAAFGEEYEHAEESMLQGLIRDEGLFLHGREEFVYNLTGLRHQEGYHRNTRVINAKGPPNSGLDTKLPAHPEGGRPPESEYGPGETIWKWATDWLRKLKRWIEYDRESGLMIEELEEDGDWRYWL